MTTIKDVSLEPIPATPNARSAYLAVFAIGLCVLVELLVLGTRQRIGAMIRDFELEVPLITIVAIGWMLPTLLACVILMAIAKEFIPALRSMVNALNSLVLLVSVGALVLYIVGIFKPLMSITMALS